MFTFSEEGRAFFFTTGTVATALGTGLLAYAITNSVLASSGLALLSVGAILLVTITRAN